MKKNYFKKSLCIGTMGLFFLAPVHAGTPVWTYSAPSPATVSVSAGSTATVQYTVTNQSNKSKNLILKATAGLSASSCYLPTKGSTCTLTLTVNGSAVPAHGIHSGPVLCEQSNPYQCYQPSAANLLSVTLRQGGVPILSANTSDLALKVSGQSRTITITNSGDSPATNLSLSYLSWPSGTTVDASSTCVSGGNLAVNASCTLVIKPGAVATSSCTTGIAPTPSIITVNANSGASTSINAVVLGYGCQYQGGFVFSIDDTGATGSIGGKVVSLVDQASPYTTSPKLTSIIWSSNGTGSSNVSFDTIPGIDENSLSALGSGTPDYVDFVLSLIQYTPPLTPLPPSAFSVCNGATDGNCNTGNILTFYNQYITSPPAANPPTATPLNYYAAGLCKTLINGYSDWYLPAICELDAASGACPIGTQSMVGTLSFLIGDPSDGTPRTSCNQLSGPPAGTDCLAGYYWSSTEFSINPHYSALMEGFYVGGSNQIEDGKNGRNGVRCVRGF